MSPGLRTISFFINFSAAIDTADSSPCSLAFSLYYHLQSSLQLLLFFTTPVLLLQTEYLCPPKIHMLKPNAQCDVFQGGAYGR